MKSTSFLLGEHFDKFIAGEIASGRYKNASEVIREGLRIMEDRRNTPGGVGDWDEQSLDEAIREGEESGYYGTFESAEELFKQLKEERKQLIAERTHADKNTKKSRQRIA